MPLDPNTTKRINEFVYAQPRTIQEITSLIAKNWRTADSYVNQISSQTGTISVKTLRPGTRGAVKLVYWNTTDSVNSTQAQQLLMKKLEVGKTKRDFSPFDIYQYVPKKKRQSFFEEQEEENIKVKQDLAGSLRKARKQVLLFSGNLSWVTIKQDDEKMIDIFAELAENGIYIKVLTKVDITSIEKVRTMLGINTQVGKDMIEIRHCEHPLRAFIVDNKFVKLKEIKDPRDYEVKKSKKTYIFYEIFDSAWIEWLQKVFWKFFASSIAAKRRINDLKTVKRL